jgi:N-acetyl-alpha-D-muramate 1-phosphate uridylyltransferase
VIAITKAMILAAGRGTRMRPLTDLRPKPLVELAGRPLIDHVLERVFEAGVSQVVVNTHYLGAQLEHHLRGRTGLTLSPESALQETGGGVRDALRHFGQDAFLVVNSDAVWLDGEEPALTRIMAQWSDSKMDALLLLYPVKDVHAYHGAGDYDVGPDGRAQRCRAGEQTPFLFTGMQVLHPRLFSHVPDKPFSLNVLYDAAENAGRLYATVHDGKWFHVGTPDELRYAERELHARSGEIR